MQTALKTYLHFKQFFDYAALKEVDVGLQVYSYSQPWDFALLGLFWFANKDWPPHIMKAMCAFLRKGLVFVHLKQDAGGHFWQIDSISVVCFGNP